MSHFFIDRPIFAWVIAIVIMIAGGLSIRSMPVNQYPNIAAPAVGIMVSYPGASAKTVQDTVVQVIEQQMNGLDNLRYISSQSNADGSMSIIVTFNQGTNPDIAQVQVQNKLQLATPMLPQEVQRQGIRVVKYQVNFMMVMGLVSEDGAMTNYDLGNYIVSNLQDPLSRVNGIGDFIVFGASYAMRIWLDPAKLNSFQLTPQDVSNAIQAQNVQVSSGSLGGRPSQNKVQLTATIIGKTRFETPEEFENILLKVMPNGAQVRVKDVAKVELGADNYAMDARYNGKPSAGLALRLATGSNLLETTERVRAAVAELEPYFPPGVRVVYPYDTSPVVAASIESVVHTLFEAIVLVFLVMYLFLQNLRTTLIPTLVVPVVLLGTFGVLAACGFTINILTMFAMVLAIGLLVDDAIVVVENVERIMQEEKLSPREATRKSMTQIQGALVGIALVISAVFIPMAFMSGATGIIYRQFSITIVSAMTLSVLMALIFTPALCATMLKEVPEHGHKRNLFFRWFNRAFDAGVDSYQHSVARVIRFRWLFLLIYAGIIVACWLTYKQIPTAFLPEEDSGSLMLQVQLPPNSTSQRTDAVLDKVIKYFLEEEKDAVESVFSVNGFNFAGRGQNSAIAFLKLRPFEERTASELSAQAVAQRAARALGQIKDAMVIPIVPPAIMEMGNATGFDIFLQDQADLGHEALMQARDQFLYLASQEPILTLVRPNGLSDEPQYKININNERVQAQNLSISDVNQTMSIAWASSYVNDFIDRGRVKKVYVQGQADSRTSPEDFNKWFVRNQDGQMVPFSSFASGEWVYGSPRLERYNGVSAVEILGQPIQGHSTGEAMQKLEEIMTKLPPGTGMAYTGLSYEERLAGSQTMFLMIISAVIVFLCLAALYESWSIPFSVMLVVPLGILGAIIATLLRGLTNDVFFQIGMLTTMGLAAKNAILIVEFASDLHKKEGKSILEAALLAARMRLRPILMTSMAFILGVLPLALSKGASSGSQHAIGTGVTGGTLAATFLAIFFVPLFYYAVASLFASRGEKEAMLNAQEKPSETLTTKENNT